MPVPAPPSEEEKAEENIKMIGKFIPGDYFCTCKECGIKFLGAKRCRICKECYSKAVAEIAGETAEEVREENGGE